jgi:hypothetical protein
MFRNTRGKEGSIRIVELGAVIGQFNDWRLSQDRIGEDTWGSTYTFQAECQYVNPELFNDVDYKPEVFIVVSRDRKTKKVDQFRLDQEEGGQRTLDGRSLLMKGVKLCRV